jgi:hypothetical protein
MRDLIIYHPGTGTVIPLSDVVYICDTQFIAPADLDYMEMGGEVDVFEHKGYRLDNHNIGWLFFGDENV